MSRHPYTYAADYVRYLAGYRKDGSGTKLSRADGSRIISGIAEAMGREKEEISIILSEYYQRNQDRLTDTALREFQQTRNLRLDPNGIKDN